ncbi:4-amino-4-deoxychorismate lyase [Brumimicrobium glaciale]|uniref:branched-chain-amino-acid transaminase n=1 Tax=Brumimicrobium glaciale TaxID=200475 RepID=A0A4Q4KJ10_9FLAO|nr:aminotransferase class IV [Brumimicrobium glaciale]RYM33313.1 4-amino-4-deoxychorismate lyase [Brumimicrobium glaciale]
MEAQYISNNGEILENNGPTLVAANRAHLYGDGLFETIRLIDGKPINLNVHILRLMEGMSVLKMRVPNYFSTDFFSKRINELVKMSNITEGGRVRLSIDRASGGTYMPDTNEVTFFIEAFAIQNNDFVLNTKGLEVDLYTKVRKEKNIFSNFKTKNGLVYVMGAIEAKEKGLDDLLITDQKGNILESTSSNIFLVSNGVLYTPGLDEGCLGGTMRMMIINLAIENKIKVYESSITPQNILIADEIFLTNAINGIVWVSGYRTKRYMNNVSKNLVNLLNNHYVKKTLVQQ